MNEFTRQVVALALGVAIVAWQTLQETGRVFAVILVVSALGYAFAPVIRDGVA